MSSYEARVQRRRRRRRGNTKQKKNNTKEVINIQNKIEDGQIQDVWASFKADFDCSGMIQGRFQSVSVISVRFDRLLIQSNTALLWPKYAQFSANRAESSQIRGKKKKLRRDTDARATASNSDAAPSQLRLCFIDEVSCFNVPKSQ